MRKASKTALKSLDLELQSHQELTLNDKANKKQQNRQKAILRHCYNLPLDVAYLDIQTPTARLFNQRDDHPLIFKEHTNPLLQPIFASYKDTLYQLLKACYGYQLMPDQVNLENIITALYTLSGNEKVKNLTYDIFHSEFFAIEPAHLKELLLRAGNEIGNGDSNLESPQTQNPTLPSFEILYALFSQVFYSPAHLKVLNEVAGTTSDPLPKRLDFAEQQNLDDTLVQACLTSGVVSLKIWTSLSFLVKKPSSPNAYIAWEQFLIQQANDDKTFNLLPLVFARHLTPTPNIFADQKDFALDLDLIGVHLNKSIDKLHQSQNRALANGKYAFAVVATTNQDRKQEIMTAFDKFCKDKSIPRTHLILAILANRFLGVDDFLERQAYIDDPSKW